jgi:Ribosomal L30 N-terminal domain
MVDSKVPESLLKKRQRDDQWRTKKAAAAAEAKTKSKETRKVIFKKAEAYVKEYRQQVRERPGPAAPEAPCPGAHAARPSDGRTAHHRDLSPMFSISCSCFWALLSGSERMLGRQGPWSSQRCERPCGPTAVTKHALDVSRT